MTIRMRVNPTDDDEYVIFADAGDWWMDVFLGHISTHFVPGRNLTWYVVFLAALILYLGTVQRITRRKPAPA